MTLNHIPQSDQNNSVDYSEMNSVADYLANEAHNYEIGIHIVDHPPAECRLLLAEDVGGISLPLSVGV